MKRDELRRGDVFKVGHRILTVVEVRQGGVYRLRDNATGTTETGWMGDTHTVTFLGRAGEGRFPAL